ncbi:MAG: hypothetical protein WC348_04875 [Patescibacteria group bacterium]|jgi:hypothetical protein
MASRNKDERAYVNALIKAIRKNSPGVYVHIDRDAGNVRHTSSGWDFMLACHGLVVFCEAKIEKGKLSTWQEFTRAAVLASKTPYVVVRFWEDGAHFTIDGGLMVETEKAAITDFIKI